MLNKKGVDAVVATVLIIMITVAAVAIIWMTIIPMIKTSLTDSTAEKVSLSIETAGGYTVWDENNENLKVQIKRGADNSNLTGIQIVFFNGMESRIYVINGSNIPSPNLMTVVGFALGGFGKPETITIYPIVNGKMGEASSKISELKVSSKVIESNEIDYGNVLTLVDEIDCSDGIDNNDNILIDCLDSSCDGIDSCEFELELSCEDSFDNDADGDVDCSDSDCSSSNNCIVQSLRQGLVGYWPFEETSGTTSVDYSGSGKNGVIGGGLIVGQTGKVGKAYDFGGSTGIVTIGNMDSYLVGKSAVTYSAWVKGDTFSTNKIIMSNTLDNYAQLEYYVNPTRITVCINTAGSPAGWCPGNFDYIISTSTWYLLTTTYNGSHISLYVNGTKVNSTLVSGLTFRQNNVAKDLVLGGRSIDTYVHRWDGMIDEVTIWNRTLSASEVSQLYNSGDGFSLM